MDGTYPAIIAAGGKYGATLGNDAAGDLTGVNSTSTTDNVITPGLGDDLIVLSTTVGADGTASSNERIVYSVASFGADTIVNFNVAGAGIDQLDLRTLNGDITTQVDLTTLVATNKSINVVALVSNGDAVLDAGENDTVAAIKVLLDAGATDDATASNHVYITYAATNIAKVYTVVDGAAADDTVATLVGTIDLADTAWNTMVVGNFL
jgi:hypothetical protein